MKKTIRLCVFLVAILVLTACSTVQNSESKLYVNGKLISFDLAGGVMPESELARAISERKNEQIVLPVPTRKGYTFAGWLETDPASDAEFTPIFFVVRKGFKTAKLYTAQWQVVTYKISTSSRLVSGSTGDQNDLPKPEDIAYNVETAAALSPMSSVAGYEFVGWIESGASESSAVSTVRINKGSTTGNKTYVALWKAKSYKIGLNLAGGTLTTKVKSEYTYKSKDVIEVPNPVRVGFDFANWSYEEGMVAEQKKSSVVINTSYIGDVSLTANWKDIEYKVSFESKLISGSSGDEKDLPKIQDECYTFETEINLQPLEAIEGYEFVGWIEKGADEASAVKAIKIAKGKITGDRALVALWKPSTYKIVLQLDGGVLEEEVKTEFVYKSDEVIEIPNPVKLGYDFKGWTYEKDMVSGQKDGLLVINTAYAKDIELKANWQAIEYPITYNEDGLIVDDLYVPVEEPEVVEVEESEPEVEEVVTNPDFYNITQEVSFINPTREGFTFLGWIEKPEGEIDVSKLTADMVLSVTELNYSIEVGTTGEKDLIAIWGRNVLKLNYDLSGGTLEESNPSLFIYGQEGFELNAPVRDFYIFMGWKDVTTGTVYTSRFDDTFLDGNVSLVAQWIPVEYTLSYDLAGGVFKEDCPVSYNYETETFSIPTPVKQFYSFTGWTIDEDVESTYDSITIYQGSHGDKTYHATWQIDVYSIGYAADEEYGPRIEPEVEVYEYPTSYTAEEIVEIRDPEKFGYDFMGWVLEDQEYTEAKTDLVLNLGSSGDRVYVPLFRLHNYNVVLDLGGGEVEAPSTFTIDDANFTITEASRTNYIFQGWLCEDGTVLNKVDVYCAAGKDVVLKALWLPIKYIISYDLSGGKYEIGAATNPSHYNVETETFTLVNPVKDTYEFAGWMIKGMENKMWPIVDYEFDTTKGGNITLVATWKAKEYKISYQLNGGAFDYADTNPTYFTNFMKDIVLVSPKRGGYNFLGWVEVGKEANKPVVSYVIKAKELRSDVSLKALWSPVSYTINYNLNGGYFARGAYLNATSYTVEDKAFILTNPVKDGFTFLGWVRTAYLATDRPTLVLRVDTSKGGYLSYDALWSANSYTITYNLDGGSYHYGNSNPKSYTAESSFTLVNPHKDGYTFLGWIASGDPLETVNKKVTIKAGTTGNLTFYAVYEKNYVAVGETTKRQTEIVEIGKSNIPRPDWVIKAPEDAKYHYEKAYASGGTLITNLENASAKCREYLAAYLETKVATVSKTENGVLSNTQSTEIKTSVTRSELVEYWEDANGGVWVLMRISK